MIEERATLGKTPTDVMEEHLARYRFALPYVNKNHILDVACGSGYGCQILADKARSVVGLDISAEAIDYAKRNHSENNIQYFEGNAYILPFDNGIFDIVISFETIEHLEDQNRYLEECTRVLKPYGTMIISTPNKALSSGENPFHIREVTEYEFRRALLYYFDRVTIYGQRDINLMKNHVIDTYTGLKRALKIEKDLFPKNKDPPVNKYPIGNFNNNLVVRSAYMIAVCDLFR